MTYEPAKLLREAKKVQPAMLSRIRELVTIESPTDDKAAVDRASRMMAAWLQQAGGKIRWHRQKAVGDILEARFAPSTRTAIKPKPVMLLGHLDTVWPMGTLAKMPFRIARGRAFGPGVYDMKTGVVMALSAIEMLTEFNALATPVILLLNSDEETGSLQSRAITEDLARECSAVFVLEPGQGPIGAYKTARKGIGEYSLHVTGVAAHSGVDFEKGHSAVLELARLIEKVSRFTDLKRGLTVNPGVIAGGTRTNVIAAEAHAHIDVRIAKLRDAAGIDRKFRALRTSNPSCRIEIMGGLNRPPMERTRHIAHLFTQAQKLAQELGFALQEASTGGGSDGNFTAALGIPTLDGMGAVGEGAHAPHESILLNALPPRTALLAAMIADHKG